MPASLPHHELPPAIRRTLDAVRRRIRAYVWLEGLAILLTLAGAAFWIGLAVDWTFEPSPNLRKFGLIVVGVVAGYAAYRYLLRRIAVRISDSTLATLLERRFPALSEHVQTAVDVSASPDAGELYYPEFVRQTQQSAAHAVASVRVQDLFNRWPLIRAVVAAAILLLSIALFALIARDAFALWVDRIALSDAPWPRRVHLEVVGFPADAAGRRVHKLAQDDDFELLVRASTHGYQAPDEVEIRFRLADGRRGRDTMIRVGEAQPGRDEFQVFRYQFKRVAADMDFDVVGGDDRVRDLHLDVVDRPELFGIEIECVYPDYLQRAARRLPVTGGMRIPEGTRLVLHAVATKPLTAVRIHLANDSDSDTQLDFSNDPQDQLRWQYGTLVDDEVFQVSVTDDDGVSTREPYRVSLSVVRDEVPQVAVRLTGIGTAITPDAILPIVGKVTDDYAIDRAWFEYQVDGADPIERPFLAQPAGAPSLKEFEPFDLRNLGDGNKLKPGQRFSLTLKASDRFDLSEAKPDDSTDAGPDPNADGKLHQTIRAGSGQPFSLDVVSPGDLLALMERRELALRQRFEAIFEKMTDTRNVLGRVDFAMDEASPTEATANDDSNQAGAEDTADSVPRAEGTPAASQRALARRRLRIAGSLQNVIQSGDEIAGVAAGFDDLDEQLTNNRIDNPDLKSRLREQIAQPMHRIAEERMPRLTAQIRRVEQHIADPAAGQFELEKSIALADEILVEMRQVLDRMLELETYNEVVSILRDIISDQEEITRRTKERQKERLRSLFEEEQ